MAPVTIISRLPALLLAAALGMMWCISAQAQNSLTNGDFETLPVEQSDPVATGDGLTEEVTVRLITPLNEGPIPRKFLRLKLTVDP